MDTQNDVLEKVILNMAIFGIMLNFSSVPWKSKTFEKIVPRNCWL